MSKCPMCNAELIEGAKFCEKCGTPVAAPVEEAPVVDTPVEAAPVVETPVAEVPVEEVPVQETAAEPTPKKKLPLKPILFGVIGVAVVAVLIFVISLFAGKSDAPYALYIKDEQLYFNGLKGDASWQVTSKLDDGQDRDNSWYANLDYKIGMAAYLSEDGKYLFFPDKLDGSSRFTLYYKSVSDPEADAVKVDSDIVSYTVNEKATLVTYLKGEDGDLYQYSMKKDEKEKIASEVVDYNVTEDGSRIGYLNKEKSVYIKDSGEDKEKMASDITSMVYIDEKLETMYYLKEGNLYLQEEGEDKVKIAEDVKRVIHVYEDGQIYYATKDEDAEPAMLNDYIIDDMAETDAAMTRPVSPSYWDSSDAWDKYYEDMDKYYAKQDRDYLRENLKEYRLYQDIYTLCYFDGKEETVITENYLSYKEYAYDAPVLLYTACDIDSVKKIKISEVQYAWEAENQINEAFEKAATYYVATEEKTAELDVQKELGYAYMTEDGSTIYYMDNIDEEKNEGEIYTVTVKNGSLSKPELYDDEVYRSSWTLVNDDQLRYFKDFKDQKGDLYVNKAKVDSDVYYARYGYTDDGIYYFTDWDNEKYQGTLKYWEDGEKTKIGDDIADFQLKGDGRLLYLQEYSLKSYKGELYIWKNGKAEKLDDDVSCIIPIYHDSFHQLGY